MRGTFSLFVVATLPLLTPVFAADLVIQSSGQRPNLIELFSSEGCSSCPPAEEWLGQLKADPQLWHSIVPVEFHVDYWDNLGWPDRFARKEYTQRQYAYSAQWGNSSVYTPGFVLNGQEWRGWQEGTGSLSPQPAAGQLSIVIQEGRATAHYQPRQVATGFTLHLAWLGLGLSSDVQRGENSGRNLTHDFIALDFVEVPLTMANGEALSPALSPRLRGNDQPGALAAWVTKEDGSLQQVAGGWLK